MRICIKILVATLGFIFTSMCAWAAAVFEQGEDVIYSDGGELRRFHLPYELQRTDAYVLKLNGRHRAMQPSPSGGGQGSGGSSPPTKEGAESLEKPRVSSLIYQANQLFKRHKYPEALSVLDTAESLDDTDAVVKTMKGSLFFVTGQYKDARAYWEKSLKIDPNQAKVREYLGRLDNAKKDL